MKAFQSLKKIILAESTPDVWDQSDGPESSLGAPNNRDSDRQPSLVAELDDPASLSKAEQKRSSDPWYRLRKAAGKPAGHTSDNGEASVTAQPISKSQELKAIAADFQPVTGWRARLASLRIKLIAPYLMLALGTALVGMFIITRLVTSTIRERFVNQLLEASRVTADGVVRKERFHLEQLRLMAFTQGVPEATDDGDQVALENLLYPLVLNAGLHSMTVVNASGEEILSLVQNPATGEYVRIQASDLSNLSMVRNTLDGAIDELGDKYVGLVDTSFGTHMLSSAPIHDEGRLVGVLLVGTRVEALLSELKLQSLADLVIFNPQGEAILTTLPTPDEGYNALSFNPVFVDSPEGVWTREITLYGRDYQIMYSPMEIRTTGIGVMGVVLPSNFIVEAESTSRNVFSLVFTLGTLGVIVIGYLLSQRISRPIMQIRNASLAVAAGDLEQSTGVRGVDEVGQMGAVFDLMTSKLRLRTDQVVELYRESVERSEELEKSNLRLQQAQQQVVQSEKLAAVGQLTAGIVHDVKNPLAVIQSLAEEAGEEAGPNEEVKGFLKSIHENTVRPNRIVSDLLKFARQSNPEKNYQSIIETVQTALRLTDFLARKGNITVTTNFRPASIATMFDATLIEQVLINLIQNAIQAMPKGGQLDVWVSIVKDEKPWVEIVIRDNGIGIPKENLKRIFDPFFTTKPAGEGTGLGLSVSYGIVKEHGGHISVESEVGKGTAFTVRLPKTDVIDRAPIGGAHTGVALGQYEG